MKSMALAAVLLIAAWPQLAKAQCAWTGIGWSCAATAYGNPGYGWDDPAFGYSRGRMTAPYAAYGAASHLGPNPGGGFYHMGSKYGQVD